MKWYLEKGPVTFNKIGGGLMKGMSPDYTKISPASGFLKVSQLKSSPIGTTISGIQYTPNIQAGYEFKLMTGFYVKDEDVFNGTGELIFRLKPEGGLEEIEVRAQGQFMEAPDPYELVSITTLNLPVSLTALDTALLDAAAIPKPNTPATLSGFASFRFNFTQKEFVGKVAAYLNYPGGIIEGAGTNGALCMVDLYFSRKDWWIWIGEPEVGKRAGMNVNLGVITAGLSGYFDIGTKVPPFPGLPARVRHLGRDLNIGSSSRASGSGFAFGAAFDLNFDFSKWGTGVEAGVGVGFDLMLRKYDDIVCLNNLDDYGNPKPIGMKGWYAMGQAWAYIDGKLKIGGFKALGLSIAAVLQMQAPNPTWGLAALELEYDTFLTGEGEWTGTVEFGERCAFDDPTSDDEFGLDLIVAFDPQEGLRDVGIDNAITANFVLPLAEVVPNYQFFDGQDGELSFQLDLDSIYIFNELGAIDFDLIEGANLNSITMKPKNFFNSNDSIWACVKVNILRDGNLYESQSKMIHFRTADQLLVIPKSNVKVEYPIDGMTNFHTEELSKATIYQQGYIRLFRGQANIFYSNDGDIKNVYAKFTSENDEVTYQKLIYDPLSYDIKFAMPAYDFLPATLYKLEIVRSSQVGASEGNGSGGVFKSGSDDDQNESSYDPSDVVYYTSYFRTSEFTTVTEKFYSMISDDYEFENIKNDKDDNDDSREDLDYADLNFELNFFTLDEGEVFDYNDFVDNGDGEPLVEISIAPSYRDLDENYIKLPLFSYYSQSGLWPEKSAFQVKYYSYDGYTEPFVFLEKNVIDFQRDYKIDRQHFMHESEFIPRSEILNMGLIQSLFILNSLEVKYNFPGASDPIVHGAGSKPLLDLSLSAFFIYNNDDLVKIKDMPGQNSNNGDVTDYIISLITGTSTY